MKIASFDAELIEGFIKRESVRGFKKAEFKQDDIAVETFRKIPVFSKTVRQ